jgi:Family of unknown function (DUF5953)
VSPGLRPFGTKITLNYLIGLVGKFAYATMTAEEITILLNARPLARNDLRPQAALRAIEAALPSEKMRYEIDDDGSLVTLDDCDARLAIAVKRRDIPLLCNGNARGLIAISWCKIPTILGPNGKTALSHAMVRLPPSFARRRIC